MPMAGNKKNEKVAAMQPTASKIRVIEVSRMPNTSDKACKQIACRKNIFAES